MTDAVVVDASVALKWFLPPEEEADLEAANALLRQVASGELRMLQPPHFVAEVAAVLARRSPETANRDLTLLQLLDWGATESRDIYEVAITLAARFRQHLFDTLYHATAVIENAELVTADMRYARATRSMANVRVLADWDLLGPG